MRISIYVLFSARSVFHLFYFYFIAILSICFSLEFVAVVQSVQAKISVKDFSNLIPCWSCKQSDFFILMLTTIFVSLTRLTGIVEGSRIACTKTEI